jgi:hypothetical protein
MKINEEVCGKSLPERKLKEKEIQYAILTYLNSIPGMFAFQINNVAVYDRQGGFYKRPGKFVQRGCSDILFFSRWGAGALECKTPETHRKFFDNPGEHEQRQLLFLRTLQQNGHTAEVVSSVEQVQAVVERLKRQAKDSSHHD